MTIPLAFKRKQKFTRFNYHIKRISILSISVIVSFMFSNNYWILICMYFIIIVDYSHVLSNKVSFRYAFFGL